MIYRSNIEQGYSDLYEGVGSAGHCSEDSCTCGYCSPHKLWIIAAILRATSEITAVP
jgi:hypothetical protein